MTMMMKMMTMMIMMMTMMTIDDDDYDDDDDVDDDDESSSSLLTLKLAAHVHGVLLAGVTGSCWLASRGNPDSDLAGWRQGGNPDSHLGPSRGCSAAPVCQNPEMVLQTAPSAPNGVDRQGIHRNGPERVANERS